MTEFSKLIESLSPAKRALLELKLKKEGSKYNSFPLSFNQQRLWFIDQFEPGNSAYNIPSAFRIIGPLHIGVLRKAINEIVRRHEILRTSFSATSGEPFQLISPNLTVNIPVIDIQNLPKNTQEKVSQALAVLEAKQSFDLSKVPLFRITLIKLGGDKYIVFLSMHHIVSDGWSMGVFIREIAILYNTFLEGKPSHLLDLTLQYADYAKWQIKKFDQNFIENELEYWRKKLGENPPVLNLPTDQPRPVVINNDGANLTFELSNGLSEFVKEYSRKEGVTLFMTLLAAFKTLLYRYTGQKDISIGSPIANRTKAETEDLIGFFINTLVLNTDLSGNPTFRELLARVKETTLEAYAHQDMPFEKLVETLEPERDTSQTPLFQVMFVLQNIPNRPVKTADLVLTPLSYDRGVAQFDLSFNVTESPEGIKGVVEYRTALFEKETIQRMVAHFKIILEHLIPAPDINISSIPILTDNEKKILLEEWNDTKIEYPGDKCVHQLFEEQANKKPETIAVVFNDDSISFKELNQQANQVANYLIKLGAKPEEFVGLFFERSVEMIVGLMGILKAGCAYVPIDIGSPPNRLKYILDDADVSILLTLEYLGSKISEEGITTVYLDKDWDQIVKESPKNLENKILPHNLAYMLYTSGSTGLPKGVQMPHCAGVNLWSGLNQTIYSSYSNKIFRVSLNAPLIFDASVQELVMLLNGFTLCIIPQETRFDGEAMLSYIKENKIDVLDCVPSQLNLLIDSGLLKNKDSFPSILLPGGEPIEVNVWKTLQETTHIDTYNMYGPTECAVDSTICQIHGGPKLPAIGRPINNAFHYILDKNMELVPIGVTGELCIGGDGLARGYHNQPDLTAEKFIPNPYSKELGSRLYRTGDLGRYIADGNIEYVGRVDQQVKIRGFRIELGEIEAALKQNFEIKDSVVDIWENDSGNKLLIGYLILANEHKPNLDILRKELKTKLPDYMIPSRFMFLDKLPLTPSGKINRRALPKPEFFNHDLETDINVLKTPTEEILANIFAKILNLEFVGSKDSFFELGGHSLLATQVISRIREHLKVDIPLRSLFETPILRDLAAKIEETKKDGKIDLSPPVKVIPRDTDISLSFAQQRLWFLDQMEPNSPLYNIPSAFRFEGKLNIQFFKQSINKIVQRHEILRTNYLTQKGQSRILIHENFQLNIPIIDLQDAAQSIQKMEVERLVAVEGITPFDLSTDPLLRIIILKLSDKEHILLLTMHHIISDGWSSGIFINEISSLYNSYLEGKDISLPELSIQYIDYAAWQKDWLNSGIMKEQLKYWSGKLSNIPEILALTTDRPRSYKQTFDGGYESIKISKKISDSLKELAKNEDVTLFMLVLTVFQILLSRYSHQEILTVGTPVANRNRSETEQLIGFFVNTLVLKGNLTGNISFKELLRRTKNTALEAYDNQEIPFEKVVDAVQPERNISHSPLFQVMFILNKATSRLQSLKELEISLLDYHSGIAKFDLTLNLTDTSTTIEGIFEYNTNLFDQSTIQRMSVHFQNVLEAVIKNPAQIVSELQLMNSEEKNKILSTWNKTTFEYPRNSCIHEIFENYVEKYPDLIAIQCEKESISYQQLNKKANQLAHYLRKEGVKAEVPVGIHMGRSVDVIISILGILKAGGCYVPLDPNYPPKRLSQIIEDLDLPLIITDEHFIQQLLDKKLEKNILDIYSKRQKIEKEDDRNLTSISFSENTAYILYTSGSTGKPKGVCCHHTGVINHFCDLIKRKPLDVGDSHSWWASLNFDVSVLEIFSSIMSGGTLHIVSDADRLDPLLFFSWMNLKKINVAYMPPFWLDQFKIRLNKNEENYHLKRLIVGVEPIQEQTLCEINEKIPCLQIFNGYGPTEATICCTLYNINFYPNLNRRTPIGKPMGNYQVFLLDETFQPVPIGVHGELFIGGIGLAQGYRNKPDVTSERFIPNPFSKIKGERLYRTGDIARYLPDGNLEFIGRVDHQVKVRGMRVELGDIESALVTYPQIDEVVVIQREDVKNEKRIVAYYVTDSPDITIPVDEVRDFLKDQLPDYMIPAIFVKIEKIPKLPNGKIDRKSLPIPEMSRSDLSKEFIAPKSDIEKTLSEIWCQLLNIDKVGIKDNFFELGGDSILAIQMIARAKENGFQFTPVQVFQHQTIESLVMVAEQATNIDAEQGLVTGEIPLTPIQHWFFYRQITDMHHFNQSVFFAVRETLNPDNLREVVKALVKHHDALRLMIVNENSEWRQSNANSVEKIPFTFVDLSEKTYENQKKIIETTCTAVQSSHDLATGNLLQVVYFDLGNQSGRLFITVHHFAIDGLSWRILLEDFQTAYKLLSQNIELQLPAKTTSFKRWSENLRQIAQGEILKKEISYWEFISHQPISRINTDHLNGKNQETTSKNISISLTEEYTLDLLQNVPSVYHTQINDILLTALIRSYERWTGTRSLWINMEGHGREDINNEIDISRTVGWFTSIYPVYLELKNAVQIGDAIKSIKEQLRQIPNNGIGFGLLRYLSMDEHLRTQLSKLDNIEISFNYLGKFDLQNKDNSLFAEAVEDKGPDRSLNQQRSHLLDITGGISNKCLNLTFSFSTAIFETDSIQQFANFYLSELQAIILHCKSPEAGGYTSSDFKMANLSQDKLDMVLSKLKKVEDK